QVIQIECFVGLYVLGDDLQQKIPFAGERVALEHFGAFADRRFEFGDRVAAGGCQLDVREDGDVEAERVAVQERNAPLDDAAFLELFNAPPAGRGGDADLGGHLGHRQGAIAL